MKLQRAIDCAYSKTILTIESKYIIKGINVRGIISKFMLKIHFVIVTRCKFPLIKGLNFFAHVRFQINSKIDRVSPVFKKFKLIAIILMNPLILYIGTAPKD